MEHFFIPDRHIKENHMVFHNSSRGEYILMNEHQLQLRVSYEGQERFSNL